METKNSQELFQRAQEIIPGGVNSPARACKSVDAPPRFIARGQGSRMFDADGNAYVDYVGSWGPLILGHAHPKVLEAVSQTAANGLSFGAPTGLEVEMAQWVLKAMPNMEMVRMVNSGTEATMSAVRLARGATGRALVVKFDGCYHGHGDSLLVAAGSGVATLGIPGSPGIPDEVAAFTASLPFNDKAAVSDFMAQKGDQVACVIVEPVVGNSGVVIPKDGFLAHLRELCDQTGSLLIIDEVMTGFRVALSGAQSLFDVDPDLTTLGKIIGGGMPVGAYGGKKKWMENIAPVGGIYQAGTLSGNPVAMAAGIANLKELFADGFYQDLDQASAKLEAGLLQAAEKAGIPACINRVGSMMTLFFQNGPVENFEDAKKSDLDRFGAWWRGMLDQGVYMPPSQFEAFFVSAAHSQEDLDHTVTAAETVFSQWKQG